MTDDPNQPAPDATDFDAKRQRKEEAERLLEPKGVFMLGVIGIRQRWFRELMDARTDELKGELVAKLQVLDAVVNGLAGFVNDYRVAVRNTK